MAEADGAFVRTIVPGKPFHLEEISKGVSFGKFYPGGMNGPQGECLRKTRGGQTWSDFIFLGEEGKGRQLAIPDIRLPANQYWPMHWHDCWTMVLVLEGSCLLGDWWMEAGDVFITEPALEYGPLVIGPDGCRMFEVFADKSGARGGYAPEYHDHPTLKGVAAVFAERSELNRRNEGNQSLSLENLPGIVRSRLAPGMVWDLGASDDPDRAMMKDTCLEPSERIAPHSYGDWHVIIVLAGSLIIKGRTLERDGFLLSGPGVAMDEIVAGSTGAHLLEFARTRSGLEAILTA